MTDNRTTELREKLTERGVDYEVKDLSDIKFFHDTRWNANGVYWCYTEFVGATTCLTMCNEWKDCTPEQAIAATLGNERATHGTLTAELVERIVDRNCEWYEGGEIDAQAIADELNAELGSGTCAMIPSFTKPVTLDDCQEFCCSACGEYMVIQQFPGWVDEVPNYCPNCGKAVER